MLDTFTCSRLEGVQQFLSEYSRRERANPGKQGNWKGAADDTAKYCLKGAWNPRVMGKRREPKNKGKYYSEKVREWA